MSIKIKTVKTVDKLVGKSHWWGAPDLPDDIPYPCKKIKDAGETYYEPLTFVCQIRCSDIAELDTDGLLPHSGFLYFFAPINYFLGETDTPLSMHDDPVVIYSEREDDLKPYRLVWEGTEDSIFRPAEAIEFSAGADTYADVIDDHALLCPLVDDIADWYPRSISLLQIVESDEWNLRFFDCGSYLFLISRQSLKARRWDKVRGYVFTY